MIDVSLNTFLHNEAKPIPFESYDCTEYIVAEGEESARKRALEASVLASSLDYRLFYLTCASSAILIVSSYFGFSLPLPVPLCGLLLATSRMVGSTALAQTSPGIISGLHATTGAAILTSNLNPIVLPTALLTSVSVVNISIIYFYVLFYGIEC